ncbi:hypothetical protein LZ24_01731 [Desulfobotulus alkaliphilus]|uniref:Uncharacterized protein n=1 Tax=Desulfobotulus alkaliphilus TaxID=622671 RepID=A0A562RTW2_9BACT|nr:hypothetical protein [Desulfobotulus alkaliphilus]TWI72323.1 hypothetical protein LZ24_01731 [Desulfobotulus alkaliphilus]
MKKILLFLLIFPFMLAPDQAQARCIVNQSSVRVKVDISFMMIERIQEWVEAGESRCIPYNFFADMRLDAVDTKEYGVAVSGTANYGFTTNKTKITVTEGRRWSSNGVTYLNLAFSREN